MRIFDKRFIIEPPPSKVQQQPQWRREHPFLEGSSAIETAFWNYHRHICHFWISILPKVGLTRSRRWRKRRRRNIFQVVAGFSTRFLYEAINVNHHHHVVPHTTGSMLAVQQLIIQYSIIIKCANLLTPPLRMREYCEPVPERNCSRRRAEDPIYLHDKMSLMTMCRCCLVVDDGDDDEKSGPITL